MNIESIVDSVLAHRRVVIVLLLLVTAVFGAGMSMVEQSASADDFQTDSAEADKLDYVEENFSARENTTAAQVIVRDENVLDRETLVDTIELQQEFRATDAVNETLVPNETFQSIANVVAVSAIYQERQAALTTRQTELNTTAQQLRAALERLHADDRRSIEAEFGTVREESPIELDDEQYQTFAGAAETLRAANGSGVEAAYDQGTRGVLAEEYATLDERAQAVRAGPDPSLAAQHDQLTSMSEEEVSRTVERLLANDAGQLLFFMPDGYEPGEAQANATVVVATQDTGGKPVAPGAAPQEIIDAQYEMQRVAEDHDGAEFVVFGSGILANEFDASMTDSLSIVGPIALLFVLVVLLIAYRDLIDVALGLFGIVAVLVWTFGFMGWAGIKFGQIFIAVPVLLIGLSIDYAIHVIMRGREARTDGETTERAMGVGLAGVGFALILVTVTTAAGFLSNLISPIPPIQEFGVVNAVGIVAALFVFGLLVPALKVEIDSALEARGIDRQRGAFGTSGRLEPLLRTGERIARMAPAAMLVLVLVVSAGGAYGATQVDTSFSTEQFIAEEPPGWTEELPESLAPQEYTAASTIDYLDDTFVRQQLQTHILVEGDPTDPATLEGVAAGEKQAANASSTRRLTNGEAAVQGPVSTMHRVAATNESFNQTLAAADTDGDGVPDRNLQQVYDALFAADQEQAAAVVHREDGEYRALLITSFASGEATRGETTEQMRAVADQVENDEATATATATGQQTVLFHIVSQELFDTVVQSLVLTLIAVILFLTIASRLTGGSASLGVVTTVPVVLALSWVLGTMHLLDIPFNSVTGMITSLTIGLGVAYSIHVSQRYRQQLDRAGSVEEALRTTVTGTGGALLGSAMTTAGGFGVLVFAFVPALQQFGFITALSIVYAFVASVLVLPSLLILWTRWFGPADSTVAEPVTTPEESAGDD